MENHEETWKFPGSNEDTTMLLSQPIDYELQSHSQVRC